MSMCRTPYVTGQTKNTAIPTTFIFLCFEHIIFMASVIWPEN